MVTVREATGEMAFASIDRSQSFRIVDRGRHVATLIAGKGQARGVVYTGCFIALVPDEALSQRASQKGCDDHCGDAAAAALTDAARPAMSTF